MYQIWEIRYTIEDEKRQSSITSLHLPPETPYADVYEFATQMAALIEPLITGAMGRFSIAWIVVAETSSPQMGADVEEKARFDFLTDYGTDADDHRVSISIPTINEEIFTTRGLIDSSNVAAAAFISAVADGIAIGESTIKPCDSRGTPVVTYGGGQEEFRPRKNRKRRWLP